MLFKGKARERCQLVSSIRLAEAQSLPAPGVGEQRVALLPLSPQKKNNFDLILYSKNNTGLFFCPLTQGHLLLQLKSNCILQQ